MSILYTCIVNAANRGILVSGESSFTKNFDKAHPEILKEMRHTIDKHIDETQFCTGNSSSDTILIYFKRFGLLLFISAVEMGLSKTSVSLYFERLHEKFLLKYPNFSGQTAGVHMYLPFEEVIKAESTKYSRDREMAETSEVLQSAKEICLQNYTNVIQRGHKIDELEKLGSRLQGVSERFRKKSKNLHLEAFASQCVFYAGLAMFLFIIVYFFSR
jgi:Synaptobrevin